MPTVSLEHFHETSIPPDVFIEVMGVAEPLQNYMCEVQYMTSGHIRKRKLSDVLLERTVFDQSEIEHIGNCEKCLEMIRILVRQILSTRPAT
jgi:hypothetical protein